MFGFNVGFANQPYFTSLFPDYVQQAELPSGWKAPKSLTKFSGNSGKSTIEHIARYTIEIGEITSVKYLKMRFFPSSLTKNVFTWFSNLRPNLILTWAHLERSFHEQFFPSKMRVSLTDLFSIKRYPRELIDDYIVRFRHMKSRCFTPIPEVEMVKIVINGLDYSIRKSW